LEAKPIMSQADDMMLSELTAMARMYKRHGDDARAEELQSLIAKVIARIESEQSMSNSETLLDREDRRA
jgi:hypothetical protein